MSMHKIMNRNKDHDNCCTLQAEASCSHNTGSSAGLDRSQRKMPYAASGCSRCFTQWEDAAFHNRRSKYTVLIPDGGSGYNAPSLANNLPMKLSPLFRVNGIPLPRQPPLDPTHPGLCHTSTNLKHAQPSQRNVKLKE